VPPVSMLVHMNVGMWSRNILRSPPSIFMI
jgi:hypothetical protein